MAAESPGFPELLAAILALLIVGRFVSQVNGRLEELAVTVRGGLHTSDLAFLGIFEALDLAAEIVGFVGLALELVAEIVDLAVVLVDPAALGFDVRLLGFGHPRQFRNPLLGLHVNKLVGGELGRNGHFARGLAGFVGKS